MLFSICQRYNFESKSQLSAVVVNSLRCCFRYVKDTILKANHNDHFNPILLKLLFSICQRYNFESKSQLPEFSEKTLLSCFRYVKDTILKANHNFKSSFRDAFELFSICQRYNFESKSQLQRVRMPHSISCFRYVKDTILKANHNV